ncbi:MAG: alpha/beta fold hydrolase [Actinomycetota bacterium]
MSRQAARLPPPGLPGLEPGWSRLVTAPDHRGDDRTWHLLDTAPAAPRHTLVCVHGNPSWSYLWRDLVGEAPSDVRVVAVDQLDMGFSERTGVRRRLADRIADLVSLVERLDIDGPVVTVGHDWGGPISLGLALELHRRQPSALAGVVLCNTAVHQPEGSPAPALIRAARTRGVLERVTATTSAFVDGALAMSRPRPPAEVRAAYRAPYADAARRRAITEFVEDIPLDPTHPSAAALDTIAAGLNELDATPALLLWGPDDRVFSDLYLHDLEARLPHADVHRFVGAAHFVPEDADVAGAVLSWIERPEPTGRSGPAAARASLWRELDRHRDSDRPAVVELHDGERRSIDFGELDGRVRALAAGLIDHGIAPGDRVALMIPPGIDLTVALYACWRMGAVMVLVDSGLGPRNMSRALASADPDHLIGIDRAMVAARALRWPGRRIAVGEIGPRPRRALGIEATLAEVEEAGADLAAPPTPGDEAPAAVVFTSGSTGPSKGVAYRHHQVQAQRDQLRALYGIGPDDALVAAFAPFALYGPALGITSVVPDMDVTKPATLTAGALADAVEAVDASLVFASPAALANVVATSDGLTAAHRRALSGVRLLLSAGAPVHPDLLAAAVELMPAAEAHTPYGMTEVLPVADIGLDELRGRRGGDGVCVGRPRAGVEVRISALDERGRATGEPDAVPGTVGEVLISADHVKDGYDRLWLTEHRSSLLPRWHRSGDVGMLDGDGYLWIGGRLEHVITTTAGPVTPVSIEVAAETVDGVRRAAAVGVGPSGRQVVAVVVETDPPARRPGLAGPAVTDSVRVAVAAVDRPTPVAVLRVPRLPVDRRHNSKIDRRRIAEWAGGVLAGERMGRL